MPGTHSKLRTGFRVPRIAAGGNFIDGAFQIYAAVVAGLDETRLWTRCGTPSVA
jgi:hypothetical protein